MTSLKHTKRSRRSQRGFTLMEILITLVVFSISIVGLVAMQSRSIEAERAANEIRNAQRIAEETMAELQSRGFNELVLFDFVGSPNPDPANPYDDMAIPPTDRIRDFRRPPVDEPENFNMPGSVRNSYIVFRRVTFVCDTNPTNPCLAGDPTTVLGLNFEVIVLWVDTTNPAFPPPPGLTVATLDPSMIDPASPNFQPFVGHVELYTYRANDGEGAPGAGGGGTGGP
jgi:prepilin-type N-terminal cleavage/methylation domain-containing protein